MQTETDTKTNKVKKVFVHIAVELVNITGIIRFTGFTGFTGFLGFVGFIGLSAFTGESSRSHMAALLDETKCKNCSNAIPYFKVGCQVLSRGCKNVPYYSSRLATKRKQL